MKKLFTAAALIATLTMALTGCSSSDSSSSAASSSAAAASSAATSAEADSSSTGVDKDVLINAEFPPYEYYEGEEIVGIDAEIAAAIAEKLGCELQIEDMAFDSIVLAVSQGKADFGMAGMTVTEDRLQSVDFSDSYATGVQVVIVTEDSPITSVDDLFAEGASHKIGVQNGTTGDIYTTDDLESAGLATIERYNKGADAVQALLTGKIDCVVIDNEPAKAFVEANEGLKILDTEYVVEDYAICFAKDSALTEPINNALNELIEDGTVKSIIDKYITAE